MKLVGLGVPSPTLMPASEGSEPLAAQFCYIFLYFLSPRHFEPQRFEPRPKMALLRQPTAAMRPPFSNFAQKTAQDQIYGN